MSKRAVLVLIGLSLTTVPALAGLKQPEIPEPLPLATMVVQGVTDAPVAPVQASEDAAPEATAEDAEAASVPTPLESAGPATIPATPADPLFIPGTRYPVIVGQAPVALPSTNAPATAQPLASGPAVTTAAAAPATAPQHRFKFRRRALK